MTPEIEKRIKAVKAGRVPAGYKKTKVGIVPKEWDERVLSDISIHVTEKNRNNEFQTTFTNSATKGVIKQTDYFDKQISNKENTDGYYVVRKFDYIYNPRISESAPCGPINQCHFDEVGIVSPLYTVFRLRNNLKENHYIEAYLKSHFWHRYMCGVANYGARHDRMNITNEDLFNLPIPFPPFAEQKKIAEILSVQDKIIELKEKLIAEKQHQKKYLTSILLDKKEETSKKRITISGITINKSKWIKVKLGELSKIKGGKRIPKGFSLTCLNTGHPYLTVTNMKNGSIIDENIMFVPYDVVKQIQSYRVHAGDIYITVAGTLGVVGIIPPKFDNANLTENADKIVDITCNKEFLYQLLLSNVIQNQITESQTNNAQPKLAIQQIQNFDLLLPSLPEQQAIAPVLSSADEEISLLQRDLEQEKLKKKSLMQLLLTGLVRVK